MKQAEKPQQLSEREIEDLKLMASSFAAVLLMTMIRENTGEL